MLLILMTFAAAMAPFGFVIGTRLGRRYASPIRPIYRRMR